MEVTRGQACPARCRQNARRNGLQYRRFGCDHSPLSPVSKSATGSIAAGRLPMAGFPIAENAELLTLTEAKNRLPRIYVKLHAISRH